MKKILIIARHGNTFRPGETLTRIGAKTDIPLVEEHRGRSIGKYLKINNLIPDAIYTSTLLRAKQTALLAVEEMEIQTKIIDLDAFVEIDYGPDENKTEEDVILRLGHGDIEKGKTIINEWNTSATIPSGWKVNSQQIIKTWKDFANNEVAQYQITLLFTSNGIIRFAPYLTDNFDKFSKEYDIKVATGSLCFFEKKDSDSFWTCSAWNIKPYKLYTDLKKTLFLHE